MANLGALKVFLTADTTQFNRGMKNGAKGIKAFKAVAVTAVAAVGAAIAKMSFDSIKAFAVQQKAQFKLQAVLKATGFAAQFTSKQLFKFAEEMSAATGIADEEIVSSMGILASFKNISGDAFKEVTKLAFDMAAVMGTDARSAFVQLGKAVNDPKAQMSALSRVGVTFTEQQKAMIGTLQDSGDLLGAQKIVMKELRSEFGGAAAEMSKAEPWKHLGNAFGDLKEEIGEVLVTVFGLEDGFEGLTGMLRDMVNWMKENGKGLGVFIREVWIEIKFAFLQTYTFAKQYTTNAINLFKTLFDFVQTNWRDVLGNMGKLFGNMWELIKKKLRGEDVDILGELTKGLKEIKIPELPNLGDKLLDNIEKLQKEKMKQLAAINKTALKTINEDTKKQLTEIEAVKKAKQEAAKKEPKGMKDPLFKQQFAGALERGTVAAFSASLGRTVGIDTAKETKKIADNTGDIADYMLQLLRSFAPVDTQLLTIGMTQGK